MQKNYKRMQHNEFLQHIDKICNQLGRYIQDNGIKIEIGRASCRERV